MMQTYWLWKQNKLRGSSSAARLLLIQNDQFLNLISSHTDLKDENFNCLLFMYSSGSTMDWYSQAVVSEEFPGGLVNVSRTILDHSWVGSAFPHNKQDALTWQRPNYITSLNSNTKPIFNEYSFKINILQGIFKRKAKQLSGYLNLNPI